MPEVVKRVGNKIHGPHLVGPDRLRTNDTQSRRLSFAPFDPQSQLQAAIYALRVLVVDHQAFSFKQSVKPGERPKLGHLAASCLIRSFSAVSLSTSLAW